MRNTPRLCLVAVVVCLVARNASAQVAFTNRWSFPISGFHAGAALGADGTLYVTTEESFGNYIYALNTNGVVQWKKTVIGDPVSPPVVSADGTIYMVSGTALLAFTPAGALAHSIPIASAAPFGYQVVPAPAVAPDGTVYAGGPDGRLDAVAPGGAIRWQFRTGAAVAPAPAIGKDGTVYCGAGDGNLYALDPAGAKKWAYAAAGGVGAPALEADGTIVASVTVVSQFNPSYGEVDAVNPDGTKRWAFGPGRPTTFAWPSDPVIGQEGAIYFTALEQFGWPNPPIENLYALNPDGTLKWVYSFGTETNVSAGLMYSTPAVGASATPGQDGVIYVATTSGILAAVAAPPPDAPAPQFTGATVAQPGQIAAAPLIDANGTVYFGSYDMAGTSTLYAVSGLSAPPKGAWPLSGRDLRHAGAVIPFEPLPGFVAAQSLGTNGIALTLVGQPETTYSVEASPDLHAWAALTNGMSANGALQFIDPAQGSAHYFYRAVLPR